jgi:putative RNA 2'-phosphotransferase
MAETRDVRISKLLSWILRHRPERVGLTLDAAGYVEVAKLLDACSAHGHPVSREDLERVVRENDKQRFAFSADGTRLRASQGHSVVVSLGYQPTRPPPQLFHGTVQRSLAAIGEHGLQPRGRQYVHLSRDHETAMRVGSRRGRPIVLGVRAAEMADQGFEFFLSANGVWLTREVPPRFLVFP